MTIKATVVLLAGLASSAAAATHTVVPGDHLWGLAGHYYKNNFRWKVIYAANQDKIKDPHWIYPGQVFEIPEVPSAAIGELPARPVEKEQAATSPEPEAAVETAKTAEPVKPAETRAPEPVPAKTDDLSIKMPQGLAGQYPSMTRVQVPKDWKDDGKITEFEGREVLAAEGDWVQGKLKGGAVGDSFVAFRPVAPQELDDPKGRYFQRVATLRVKEVLGGSRYRFIITKSADTVQVGDLLKREGAAR